MFAQRAFNGAVASSAWPRSRLGRRGSPQEKVGASVDYRRTIPGIRREDLASLGRATAWLNSAPLTAGDLRGKVVLVDFWTYTCINWLRTLPYVRAWADKYKDQGLVVIGVHTPEFAFEQDIDNVRRAVEGDGDRVPGRSRQRPRDLARVRQPLLAGAVLRRRAGHDPGSPLRRGRLRSSRKRSSSSCWPRPGNADVVGELVPVEAHGPEVAADWGNLRSPETYVGYRRAPRTSRLPAARRWTSRDVYAAQRGSRLNQWALSGEWTVRQRGRGAERGRRADRVSLSRA